MSVKRMVTVPDGIERIGLARRIRNVQQTALPGQLPETFRAVFQEPSTRLPPFGKLSGG